MYYTRIAWYFHIRNPKPSSGSGCWSVVLPDSPRTSTSAAAVDTAQTTETASPPVRQSRFVEDGELPSTSTEPQPGNLRVHLHCLDPISGELFACVVIYYLLDVCYTVKFASFTQKHYFSSILQNYCRIWWWWPFVSGRRLWPGSGLRPATDLQQSDEYLLEDEKPKQRPVREPQTETVRGEWVMECLIGCSNNPRSISLLQVCLANLFIVRLSLPAYIIVEARRGIGSRLRKRHPERWVVSVLSQVTYHNKGALLYSIY